MELDIFDVSLGKEEGFLKAIHKPSAALVERDGIVIDITDKGEYTRRKVGFNVWIDEAIIHILTKQIFRVV